ncbi:alkaline phosphatase D family protein [Aestuariibacter sp. AA17]|uniref:Alkaline phosphatase D family protein n=1 Tax=Fluctibacter corallii TaxID=2984329 RepID=A0ABT3A474_9ALTE|nr:alkaline phosphatase D family protein [Aestuariibacter sp. AA17]MCV2883484.1 alkaline phosphatase D family protein [Aestuariibacter sp. AA17]
MKLTRRSFLKASAAGFGATVISLGLTGCLSDNDNDNAVNQNPPSDNSNIDVGFKHGVASGDPLNDSVIIWTRVTPSEASVSAVDVRWEVARDPSFTQLVHDDTTQVTRDSDFTLKVDVRNLDANTTYYYRFSSNEQVSPIGETKTLPEGSVDKVKLAVFSCANYPAGYFHVYGEAAKRDDIDAVLHLGDYLYEYGENGYASQDAVSLGRTLSTDNNSEIISLDDYRKRYALYRTDAQLQALHQGVPFITVWDDHEVTNDTWRNGAQNHDDSEGSFDDRKLAALKAYFEWMPIRDVDNQEMIYRKFEFGDLLSLYMLDTRVIARDKQLSYSDYDLQSPSGQATFMSALSDSNRSLLGADQLNWLTDNMQQSSAVWQVLGQQVLMTKMWLPAEVMMMLGNLQATIDAGGDPAQVVATANQLFVELGTIKGRILAGDPTVSAAERARVETTIPYNLDAWDGYAYERETILATSKAMNKNLVVLAGDTHNGWAGNLITDANNPVIANAEAGVEFATASVSSPGMEAYLNLDVSDLQGIAQTEQVISMLIDHLRYTNLVDRGYLTVTFSKDRALAEWHYVSSIKSQAYEVNSERGHAVTVMAGQNTLS